jgi:hypothetical protein
VRRAALIALALLGSGRLEVSCAGPPGNAALGEALRAIDACIAHLDAEVDVGYERIAVRCPDLRPALETGGFGRWLPPDWRNPDNNLSAGGLEELHELLARELTLHPVRRTPSVQRLRQVLAELGTPARPRRRMWSGLEDWLRRVVEPREPTAGSGGLARLLRRIDLASGTERLIVYAALAGLVALAALILFNELRLAGALRAQGRRSGERTAREAVDAAAASVGLHGGEPEDRARMLLGAILERLSRARGLTGLRGLTARELIRAVDFGHDAEAARQLAQLALTTERVRYAPAPASCGEIAAAVQGARALLARLTADGTDTKDASVP